MVHPCALLLLAAPAAWKTFDHINCYLGHGVVTNVPVSVYISNDNGTLESTVIRCRSRCVVTAGCTAITTRPTRGGAFQCWLRGPVDIAQCVSTQGRTRMPFRTHIFLNRQRDTSGRAPLQVKAPAG